MSSLPPAVLLLCALAAAPASNPASAAGPFPPPDDSTRTASSDAPFASSWNRVSMWAAGSSVNGRLIGRIPQSVVGLLGVRYHRRLAPSPESWSGGLTYTYVIDVLPAAFVSVPGGSVPRTSLSDTPVVTEGTTTFGVGVAPIGLRLTYRTAGLLQPYIAWSVGALYFVQSVPDSQGKRLNFTVDGGGGVQLIFTSAATLTIGYRYLHLSNGFRGAINPGIDAHLFHLGVTVVP